MLKTLEKIRNKFLPDFSGLFKKDGNEQNTISLEAKKSMINAHDIVGHDKISIENVNNTINVFDSKERIDANLSNNLNKDHVSKHNSEDIAPLISLRIKEAENLQEKRKFQEALTLYTDILSDPTFSMNLKKQVLFTINNNIGICYLNIVTIENNIVLAKKYFDRAFSLKSGSEEEKVYLTFAFYYYELRDTENALEYAKKALALKPDYVKAINIIALVRQDNGENLDEILSDLYFDTDNKLRKIFLDNKSALITLGQLFLRENRIDESIVHFENVLDMNSDDYIALALLGSANMVKAFKYNMDIKDINISSDIDFTYLKKTKPLFEKAFELANELKLTKSIAPFLSNYALVCCLLGEYNNAYRQITEALQIGIQDENAIKSKAKIESLSGEFKKAIQTYKSISNFNQKSDMFLILLIDGKYDALIANVKDNLRMDDFSDFDEKAFQISLAAEAYIFKGELSKAYDILKTVKTSNWRIKVVLGTYYWKVKNKDKAEKYYIESLQESASHPRAFFELVDFYGNSNQFDKIIELLEKYIKEKSPIIEVFNEPSFVKLAKAYFFNDNYNKAIEISNFAITKGVKREIFLNVIANSYLFLMQYKNAHQVLSEIYDINPNSFENCYGLANVLLALGRVEESAKYFKLASRFKEASSNPSFYMAYSQTELLSDRDNSAFELAISAKEICKNDPKSAVHAFYMHMTTRCGEIDSAVKYAIDFNATFPKEKIVTQITAIEKDANGTETLSDEFQLQLSKIQTNFEIGISHYKSKNLPIYFLGEWFHRNLNEIYSWRSIYKIPIFIDSGNPQKQSVELLVLKEEKVIVLDFLSLLVFQSINILNKIVEFFDYIHITQSLFSEIQSSLIVSEDKIVRDIWNILRLNEKVIFSTNQGNNQIDYHLDKKVYKNIFGETIIDCMNVAKTNNLLFCIGDDNLKPIALDNGIRITGIYSVIMHLFHSGLINKYRLSEIKLQLINEHHTFISFTEHDLISISSKSGYRVNEPLKAFFNTIFKNNPDIFSFIKVFINSISYLISQNISYSILDDWFELYINTFNQIFIQDLLAKNHPQLIDFSYRKTIDKLDWDGSLFGILAIIDLYAVIEVVVQDPLKKKQLKNRIPYHISSTHLFNQYYSTIVPIAEAKANYYKSKRRTVTS